VPEKNADDPQLSDHVVTMSQVQVLAEAAKRIHQLTGLSHMQKHRSPLLVLLTKFDVWSCLLEGMELRQPWNTKPQEGYSELDLDYIEVVSKRLRALLLDISPKIVGAAEDFAERVMYLPVSSSGVAPEEDPESKKLGFRTENICPQWVEVPVLYALCRWTHGVIPRALRKREHSPPPQDGDAHKGS
jgi:hypothetical protein